MRARVYSNGGNSTGGFTFNGGQLTGALILAGNPSEPLEAASKQYVDSSMVNLSASNLTTGTLPSGRLPSFAGDIVKPAGSSTINLAPIGITAGDYVKPTVDSKGRVTGGSALVADDITNLSWDKITSGKPTTLAGYGINDGVSLTGGTLSGFLRFNGSVSNNMQAVTKQYVDVTLSSSSGIAIGDIIRKPYATTPSGFLKCNGGEVDKVTYNALYSVIGDRFNKGLNAGSGQPWRQQYLINDTQKNDISSWSTGVSLPSALFGTSTLVTKNRAYLVGGYNGSSAISTIYTATINTDGTLGAWVTTTALPGALCYSTLITTKNRVYLFGGYNGSSYTSIVYTAPINSDGTLGAWTTGTSLPITLGVSQGIVTKNRVYLCSGHNGSATISDIYTCVISEDGTLGAWSTDTSLPLSLYWSQVIVTKNRVYLIGGASSTTISTVYTAIVNENGTLGSWSISGYLPSSLSYSSAIVTKNRVYLLGGYNGSATASQVYTAPINEDGTLGTWVIGSSLPGNLHGTSVITTKNRVYLLGGYNGSSYTSVVYTAPIIGGLNDYSDYYALDKTNYTLAGSGQPWQQQYQINPSQAGDISGWSTTTSLPVTCHYSSAIVTKNRVYLLGGILAGVTSSTVYTAPINTDGTLGAWTTDTSLPGVLSHSAAIVTKNRVYLLGGYNGSSYLSAVYTAPINSDGTLGAWATGTSLPGALGLSRVFITKNRVYMVGGISGGYTSIVYTAPINSDGTLGAWSTGTSLPAAIDESHCVVTKNRVYLLGGYSGGYSSAIYTAFINSDGTIGTWSTAGVLPVGIGVASIYSTLNTVYLFGGYQGSYPTTCFKASINTDGTLGAWSTTTSLVQGGSGASLFATKNRLYICGGSNGTTSSAVQVASILEGENDYSPYYDGSVTPNEPVNQSTVFALPDLTGSESFDTTSYIKY